MDRELLIARLESFFAHAPGEVVAAYLFGSSARGEARPRSDVDIAVLFDPQPPSELGALPQRLEDALERELRVPVQVVTLNAAPADLVHRVLRDGAILLDRDRDARLRFEVDRRNEYFDLQPILRHYRTGSTAG